MKALIIAAHPNDKSFNRAILSTVIKWLDICGAEFRVRNLYTKRFNCVLEMNDFKEFMAGRVPEDILQEQEDISWADTLIFIYPIWWWGPPAILKGWIDRVFSMDFAYKRTPEGIKPLLTNKKALVITTSGSNEEIWNDKDLGMAVSKLVIEGIFGVVGIYDVIYKNFSAVPTSEEQDRNAMLQEVKEIIQNF